MGSELFGKGQFLELRVAAPSLNGGGIMDSRRGLKSQKAESCHHHPSTSRLHNLTASGELHVAKRELISVDVARQLHK